MRADRLLAILLHLQTHGRLTARELARRLEVSERTIYRDIEALSSAGVPVYAERGRGGGCLLLEPYRTTLTGMTEPEARALFVAGATRPLTDLGLGDQGKMALLKLLAALPAAYRAGAEAASQRIHIDPTGWFQSSEATPQLRTLSDALMADRRITIQYQRGDGTEVTRLLDPLGLVAKAGIWYLLGGAVSDDAANGQMRNYRVSRIISVTLTDTFFQRPQEFDLARCWEESREQFRASLPRYEATVRIAPYLMPELHYIFGEIVREALPHASPPDAQGWVTLPILFDSFDAARGRILSLGDGVEVMAPAELRAAVARAARAIVARYAED